MSKAFSILGISAYYHDSAAALLVDGKVIAAAHEERFTRKKHDASFPRNAITYVLSEAGLRVEELTAIAFYDKPLLKFERLLESYHAFAPAGLGSFITAMPLWIKEKLYLKKIIRDELRGMGKKAKTSFPPLLFPEHHLSHAASAYYPSPFSEAAILTIDGVGEWATTTICKGSGNAITLLRELDFPHSLGLLYSAFTYYCGFKVNSGEYKLMGLAPYGDEHSAQCQRFKQIILDTIIELKSDGAIFLNMEYFSFATGLRMCNDRKWTALFGIPPRRSEDAIDQAYMDLAFAIQSVCETVVLRLARTARELTGCSRLVMAGGVALNCVANGKLLREGIFDSVWIQPAAGDAGGALGAAYAAYHIGYDAPLAAKDNLTDRMAGSYLGPSFTSESIHAHLVCQGAVFEELSEKELFQKTAVLIAEGNVVGWFQGRMEWGPRALGNRSILGDARNPDMQKKLNLKIKYREGFRPFAPIVLEEDANLFFNIDSSSPYMLFVAPIQEARRTPLPPNYHKEELYKRLYFVRSDIPAVTHVDYSARIQTVSQSTNQRLWQLLKAFKDLTGYGVMVNTSFNVRGEPIVCSPEDAYRCFMRTEMDYLVMGNFILDKKRQPKFHDAGNWRSEFALD